MGNAGNSKLSYHKKMSHSVGKAPFNYGRSSRKLVCTPSRSLTVRTYGTGRVDTQAGGKGDHHAVYNGPAVWRDTYGLARPVRSSSLTCLPEQSVSWGEKQQATSAAHFHHHEHQPKCHLHQSQQHATQHVHHQSQQYATQHVHHQSQQYATQLVHQQPYQSQQYATQLVHQQPQQYATQLVHQQPQQYATQLVHQQPQHYADAARFSVLMPGSELLLTTLTQPKQHELHPVHHTAFDCSIRREQADYVCVSPSAINEAGVVSLPQEEVHSYYSQRYHQGPLKPQPSFTGGALSALNE